MTAEASFDFEEVDAVDVSRFFGRRRALAHVTFRCRRGEIVGVLGPNGSGKSTLLAVLATLLAPSSGSVRYGGRTARELGGRLRARIGLLAHDLQLYPDLTARENLEFFAGLYGLRDRTSRVERALERAGLIERGDELVARFSRGMRQRLALERTWLHDPRLVLLDEPFTGLDERAAGHLVDRLHELAAGGRIVLLATHDLELAAGLCTRVVLLREGRLAGLEEGGRARLERYRAVLSG
jgi:heme exporter protein A